MRVIRCAALLTLLALSLTPPAAAQADTTALPDSTTEDVIYYKAGGTLRGRILDSETTKQGLLIRTRDGRDVRISHDQIARVVRGQRPAPPVAVAATATPSQAARHDPTLAWFLSFLIPGVGQYYNGEFAKGVGFMGAQILTAGVYLNNQDCSGAQCQTATLAFVLMMVNWVACQIDAPTSARAINRRNGLSLEVGPQPHPLGWRLASLSF